MVADGRRMVGTEAAKDVDGSRISPEWMRACSRSSTEDAGGLRRLLLLGCRGVEYAMEMELVHMAVVLTARRCGPVRWSLAIQV